MRKSIKLITVAAATGLLALGAGSAFTASNTVPASVAGFGEGLVTGATVTTIHYTPNAADPSKLDSVVFDTTTDVTNTTITMVLKDNTLAVMGSPYSCSAGTPAAGSTPITCATADHPSIASLGATDLTVANT